MVEAENHELHWYALKVFYNKVFAVEEELTADGTECYVPVEETMVERCGQRRKVRRPVINSLMFFRAAEERAVAVQRQLTDRAILYTRHCDDCRRKPYAIPDREMNGLCLSPRRERPGWNTLAMKTASLRKDSACASPTAPSVAPKAASSASMATAASSSASAASAPSPQPIFQKHF